MVLFSSRSSSGSSNVPSNAASLHQRHGPRDLFDDRCHSGWMCDTYCTTRLHDTTLHILCLHSHHYLDLELKMVYRHDKRESYQQFLKHWIKKMIDYYEQDKVDKENKLSEGTFSHSCVRWVGSGDQSRTRDKLKVLIGLQDVVEVASLPFSSRLAIALTHRIMPSKPYTIYKIGSSANVATENKLNHLSKNRVSACICHSHS